MDKICAGRASGAASPNNRRAIHPSPLLQIDQLRKQYAGTMVVDGVSFSIAPGECLGIIGPNGAGKTTTIRMCMGLTAPHSSRRQGLVTFE